MASSRRLALDGVGVVVPRRLFLGVLGILDHAELEFAYIGALAMLEAERKVDGATITTFGDAIWWAATTVTTVTTAGYGDKNPISDEGHYLAIGLMIAGITVIGLITASLASWLVETGIGRGSADQAATRK